MDPAEFLSLGTPHPIDTQNVGKGTAPCRWEFADAGWALAGLPTHQELLLRVKYMQDNPYNLVAEVVGHAISRVLKWGRLDESLTIGQIRRVTEAALVEFVAPSTCLVCNARECPICGNKEGEPCGMCCPVCNGAGVTPYSERKGKALQPFRGVRDAGRVFDEVSAMLSRWEGKGLRLVKRRLRRERGTKPRQWANQAEKGAVGR